MILESYDLGLRRPHLLFSYYLRVMEALFSKILANKWIVLQDRVSDWLRDFCGSKIHTNSLWKNWEMHAARFRSVRKIAGLFFVRIFVEAPLPTYLESEMSNNALLETKARFSETGIPNRGSIQAARAPFDMILRCDVFARKRSSDWNWNHIHASRCLLCRA